MKKSSITKFVRYSAIVLFAVAGTVFLGAAGCVAVARYKPGWYYHYEIDRCDRLQARIEQYKKVHSYYPSNFEEKIDGTTCFYLLSDDRTAYRISFDDGLEMAGYYSSSEGRWRFRR